jgi:IS5 family transposase
VISTTTDVNARLVGNRSATGDPQTRYGPVSPARKSTEHGRAFRQLVKWRTGCEGRISYLKRGYGWDRTRLDGKNGAAIWCGHGVFAHNLVKISALVS